MPNSQTKFEKLKRNLKKRNEEVTNDFEKKQVKALKWLAAKNLKLTDIYHASTQLLTTGTLAGTMLLTSNLALPQFLPAGVVQAQGLRAQLTNDEFHRQLSQKLIAMLPADIGKVSGEKEKNICQTLEKYLGFPVCFRLKGNELNYFYAWTGYEQHLYRYPGDSLEQHDEEQSAGIAPGLGAWGYFAESKETMTQKDYLREKYYVAVQTLYLPEWQTDYQRIYDWYKYRKVVMVNPENGSAVVAVVGDAGPADWTGKQFGGSPEVMKTLNLHEEWQKGKVLLLFVEDGQDKIPLGPVEGLKSAPLAKA